MHELAICQALLDQVDGVVRANGAAAVQEIVVAVGPLSGVEPTLLAEAFALARRGACTNAELHLETAAITITCAVCGEHSECAANALVCRHCGASDTHLVSGDELMLLRVRLETESQPAPN